MAGTQSQAAAVPSAGAATRRDRMSPFLIEPDSAPAPEGDLPVGGESYVIRELERLERTQVKNETAAFELIDPLLEKVEDSSIRAVIIRALRTSGVAAFNYEQVRTKALEALQPYVADGEILYLFLQELEGHPNNHKACKAAARGINRAGVIEDRDACERIVRLIAELDGTQGFREGVGMLSPILVHSGDDQRSARLARTGDRRYRSRDSATPEELRAMALSSSELDLSKLVAWGTQSVYQRFKWELGLIWPAVMEAGYFGVMGMGWLVSQPVSGPAIPFTAAQFWPLVLAIGAVVGVSHAILRYFSHRIENNRMSIEALQAMRYAFGSPLIQNTLSGIATNESCSEPVQSAAQASLDQGRSLFLVNCLNGVANGSKKAEQLLRTFQGSSAKTLIAELVSGLMRDRSPEVQEVAYRTFDRIGAVR